MTRVLQLDDRRKLAQHVVVDGYYTDGRALCQVEAIGATGCVVFRDCVTGWDRCLSIDDFRAAFWLVRAARAAA